MLRRYKRWVGYDFVHAHGEKSGCASRKDHSRVATVGEEVFEKGTKLRAAQQARTRMKVSSYCTRPTSCTASTYQTSGLRQASSLALRVQEALSIETRVCITQCRQNGVRLVAGPCGPDLDILARGSCLLRSRTGTAPGTHRNLAKA